MEKNGSQKLLNFYTRYLRSFMYTCIMCEISEATGMPTRTLGSCGIFNTRVF